MVERKRHLAKAVTYRFFGSAVTGAAAFVISGSAAVGAGLFVVDTFAKIGLYYVHERVWYRIKWGVHDAARLPPPAQVPAPAAAMESAVAEDPAQGPQVVVLRAATREHAGTAA